MESNPTAAVFHVLLEGAARGLAAGTGVQTDDDAVLFQPFVRVTFKRGGLVHNPSFAIGQLVEKLDGLTVKLHMGFLGTGLPVQEGFEAWGTGIVGWIAFFLGGDSCQEAEPSNQC